MVMCPRLTYFSCGDCENMYNLSYHHYEIGIMNQNIYLKLWSNIEIEKKSVDTLLAGLKNTYVLRFQTIQILMQLSSFLFKI